MDVHVLGKVVASVFKGGREEGQQPQIGEPEILEIIQPLLDLGPSGQSILLASLLFTPARLYSSVIMDPVWGYEAINVEAQQSDPSSLLSWMRNVIALRKRFRVFGRRSTDMIRRTARFWRTSGKYEDEQVLCVANLAARRPGFIEGGGMTPVEMLGYVEFPPIEHHLIGLHCILWFSLAGTPTKREAHWQYR